MVPTAGERPPGLNVWNVPPSGRVCERLPIINRRRAGGTTNRNQWKLCTKTPGTGECRTSRHSVPPVSESILQNPKRPCGKWPSLARRSSAGGGFTGTPAWSVWCTRFNRRQKAAGNRCSPAWCKRGRLFSVHTGAAPVGQTVRYGVVGFGPGVIVNCQF